MFLLNTHSPTNASEMLYNIDVINYMIYLSQCNDNPHMIISGPNGGGKKTITNVYLSNVYNETVANLRAKEYEIQTNSTKKKAVTVMESDYHVIFEPTNTNYDRVALQEIIKNYINVRNFSTFTHARSFKTIVIYNTENLSKTSQAIIKKTMEIKARNCKFILICNNLSSIITPIRSRCINFCIPLPSSQDIARVVSTISIREAIVLDKLDYYNIVTYSNTVKDAIWKLEYKKLKAQSIKHVTKTARQASTANTNTINDLVQDTDAEIQDVTTNEVVINDVFQEIIGYIIEILAMSNKDTYVNKQRINHILNEFRNCIYQILITNMTCSSIITMLLDKIIELCSGKSPIGSLGFEVADGYLVEIIDIAIKAEYNLIKGRREIFHFDRFFFWVIRILSRVESNHNRIIK
ncbi:Replication factor C small subunit [uncultured virus]|nr:Replication factor C small subunit [uncultured virus]